MRHTDENQAEFNFTAERPHRYSDSPNFDRGLSVAQAHRDFVAAMTNITNGEALVGAVDTLINLGERPHLTHSVLQRYISAGGEKYSHMLSSSSQPEARPAEAIDMNAELREVIRNHRAGGYLDQPTLRKYLSELEQHGAELPDGWRDFRSGQMYGTYRGIVSRVLTASTCARD